MHGTNQLNVENMNKYIYTINTEDDTFPKGLCHTKAWYTRYRGDDQLDTAILSEDYQTIIKLLNRYNEDEKIHVLKILVSLDKIDIFNRLRIDIIHLSLSYDDNIFFKIAIIYGAINMIKYLIKEGIDITTDDNFAIKNVVYRKPIPCEFNFDGKNVFGLESELISLLITNGANIHVDDDYPLCRAATTNKWHIVMMLLEYGANIHARNDYILTEAAARLDEEIIRFLINHGSNIHANKSCAFRTVVRNTEAGCIKLFLDAGSNVNELTQEDLVAVIQSGSYEVTKLLIENGVDFSIVNNYTHEKTRNNTSSMLNLLEESNVDIKLAALILHNQPVDV